MKHLAILSILAATPFMVTMTAKIQPAHACNIANPPPPCANFPGADPVPGIGTLFQEQFRPFPGTSPFATDPFNPFLTNAPESAGTESGDPDPNSSVMDEITGWQFRGSQPRRPNIAPTSFPPEELRPGDFGYVPNVNPFENPFVDAANASGFAPRYVVRYNDVGLYYVVWDTETGRVVARRTSAESAENVRQGLLEKLANPPSKPEIAAGAKPGAGAKPDATPGSTDASDPDGLQNDLVNAAIDTGIDRNSRSGDAPVSAPAPSDGATGETATTGPTGIAVLPNSEGIPTILINGTPFKERLGSQQHLQRLPDGGQMDEEITVMQTEDGKIWGIGADGHNFGSMRPSRNQFFEGRTIYSFDNTPVQRSTPAAIRNAALTTDAQTVPIFSDGFESGDTSAWSASQP